MYDRYQQWHVIKLAFFKIKTPRQKCRGVLKYFAPGIELSVNNHLFAKNWVVLERVFRTNLLGLVRTDVRRWGGRSVWALHFAAEHGAGAVCHSPVLVVASTLVDDASRARSADACSRW